MPVFPDSYDFLHFVSGIPPVMQPFRKII